MQRMNGSAARTDGYNTRIIDMEELKKARESRASSARNPSEGRKEAANPPAFWEQEDPFNERRNVFRHEEPEREEKREDRRNDRPAERRGEQRNSQRFDRRDEMDDRDEDRQDERYDWRQNRRPSARQPREAEQRRAAPARGRDRRASEPRTGRQDTRAAGQGGWREDTRRARREQENQTRWEYEFRPQQEQARRPASGAAAGSGRAGRQERAQERRQDERSYYRPGSEQSVPETGRRSRTGYYVLFLMLALVVLGVVIGMKVFNIKTIDVKGNDTVTSQNIVALSGIGTGQNIFMADLTLARKNIESDPLLEVLGISRVFPDKIEIRVKQRKPHGAIAYLGSYVIIDEKGTVLDVRDSLPVGQYPLLTGMEIQPSAKGKQVTGVDGGVLKAMNGLLSSLYNGKAMQYVSTVNMANAQDIKMYTGEGIEIDVGAPTDLDKKAQWIACTVPELRSRGLTSGTLYVTGTNTVFSEADKSSDGQQQDSAVNGGASDGQADEQQDDAGVQKGGADDGSQGGDDSAAGA